MEGRGLGRRCTSRRPCRDDTSRDCGGHPRLAGEANCPWSPDDTGQQRTGEDNAEAHFRSLTVRSRSDRSRDAGKLDFAWQRRSYGEWDGQRPKRGLIKAMGEKVVTDGQEKLKDGSKVIAPTLHPPVRTRQRCGAGVVQARYHKYTKPTGAAQAGVPRRQPSMSPSRPLSAAGPTRC